jgi:hypothetical protein
MIYAVTNSEGVTTYDLTFEDAMALYVEGSRLWASQNEGLSYFEIFVP